MNARQPPKLEMSRAPAIASASTRKPFTPRPSARRERADRQRRRDRGDEAAERLPPTAPRLRARSQRPSPGSTRSRPGFGGRGVERVEPVVRRGRGCLAAGGPPSARNSPLSGMPERCAPTTAIAISPPRAPAASAASGGCVSARARPAAVRCRRGRRGRSQASCASLPGRRQQRDAERHAVGAHRRRQRQGRTDRAG